MIQNVFLEKLVINDTFSYVASILSAYIKNMLICSVVCLYIGFNANVRSNYQSHALFV